VGELIALAQSHRAPGRTWRPAQQAARGRPASVAPSHSQSPAWHEAYLTVIAAEYVSSKPSTVPPARRSVQIGWTLPPRASMPS